MTPVRQTGHFKETCQGKDISTQKLCGSLASTSGRVGRVTKAGLGAWGCPAGRGEGSGEGEDGGGKRGDQAGASATIEILLRLRDPSG